ncbi:hypothetical protein VTN77DRAFT_3135 [Rasamsonia byssochlamydoides]|uniref:uncharacterized protein n=1 Tax=Rasamsonia byssochlamydoides TaxID=89139 RepID=UPI0037448B71
MDNEIPLPPPPRIRHRSPANASSTLPPSSSPFQKPQRPSRSRLDDLSSIPSSDPAFFSSDDIPSSSLDNYNGPVQPERSKKRRYRGTWWGEMAVEAKRKRGDFKEKRNWDSGVWMGSDESSSECLFSASEDASSCEEYPRHVRDWNSRGQATATIPYPKPACTAVDSRAEPSNRPTFQARAVRGVEEPKEHQVARALVNDYLDKGQDSVDLSNGNLRTIPSGLLRPLLHLTKQPAVKDPPVTDEVYASLTPFLRLFLAGNSLTDLPAELFELGNLKVLSLRNNKLREIPAAIRKLTKLQEINVSVNRLQYLPWEILWLIKKGDLKHLVVHPNPFLQLEEAGDDIEAWHYGHLDGQKGPGKVLRLPEYEGPAPEEAWAPIHVATGRVQRLDSEGFPVADGKSRGGQLSLEEAPSRVPSLRELALLECNRFPYLDQFLDGDLSGYPELVARLLRQARDVRNAGGRCCSICHRSFVIARAQWIEWWDCTTYENGLKGPRAPGAELRPLPFLRRGCSWACVPGAASQSGDG